MEDNFYDILKEGELGKKVIEKYHNQTIEELASVLTEGMMKSYVGDNIKRLESFDNAIGVYGFEAICKGAFKAAVLRLLREAKTESEMT